MDTHVELLISSCDGVVFSVAQVGARWVINAAGLLLIFFGLLGKFGAVFVSIPDPIIGGSSAVLFGW